MLSVLKMCFVRSLPECVWNQWAFDRILETKATGIKSGWLFEWYWCRAWEHLINNKNCSKSWLSEQNKNSQIGLVTHKHFFRKPNSILTRGKIIKWAKHGTENDLNHFHFTWFAKTDVKNVIWWVCLSVDTGCRT